jgi:hypothetical protein
LLTPAEALFLGTSFDDIFEEAVLSNDLNRAVNAFACATGHKTSGCEEFLGGDNILRSYLFLPDNMAGQQSLAYYNPECEDEIPPEDPGNPGAPPVRTTGGFGAAALWPLSLGLLSAGLVLNRKKQ